MKCERLILLASLLIILAACQSSGRNTEQPSTYLDLTAGSFDITDYWVRDGKDDESSYSLFFPEELAKRSLKGCAEIIFGINSEGKFTGYKSVYSYPDEYVATAAGAHMSKLKWVPGDKNPEGRAVLARAYLVFEMENGSRNEAGFTQNCEIRYSDAG